MLLSQITSASSALNLKKLRILIFLLIFSLFAFPFILPPETAIAQVCNLGPNKDQCPAAGIIQVQELLTRIISISTTIAFMALTIWLVWGALKFFITSGGDPKALAHAWGSVTWAFMGLVFLVLAYLAIKLIVEVTGAPVDRYCLGFPPYCAPI